MKHPHVLPVIVLRSMTAALVRQGYCELSRRIAVVLYRYRVRRLKEARLRAYGDRRRRPGYIALVREFWEAYER